MDKRTSWASLVLESSDDEHVEETPIKRLHRVVESSDDEKESNSEHENVEQSQYDSTLPFEDYDDAVSSTTNQDEATEELCPICLDASPDVERAQTDSCTHSFCLVCISEWAKTVTTCPHCRKPFENLLVLDDNNDVVRRIEVEKKQPVDLSDVVLEVEDRHNDYCDICFATDFPELLLLCDSDECPRAMHTYCCDPPLDGVPEGEWVCSECSSTSRALSRSRSSVQSTSPPAPVRTSAQARSNRRARVQQRQTGTGPDLRIMALRQQIQSGRRANQRPSVGTAAPINASSNARMNVSSSAPSPRLRSTPPAQIATPIARDGKVLNDSSQSRGTLPSRVTPAQDQWEELEKARQILAKEEAKKQARLNTGIAFYGLVDKKEKKPSISPKRSNFSAQALRTSSQCTRTIGSSKDRGRNRRRISRSTSREDGERVDGDSSKTLFIGNINRVESGLYRPPSNGSHIHDRQAAPKKDSLEAFKELKGKIPSRDREDNSDDVEMARAYKRKFAKIMDESRPSTSTSDVDRIVALSLLKYQRNRSEPSSSSVEFINPLSTHLATETAPEQYDSISTLIRASNDMGNHTIAVDDTRTPKSSPISDEGHIITPYGLPIPEAQHLTTSALRSTEELRIPRRSHDDAAPPTYTRYDRRSVNDLSSAYGQTNIDELRIPKRVTPSLNPSMSRNQSPLEQKSIDELRIPKRLSASPVTSSPTGLGRMYDANTPESTSQKQSHFHVTQRKRDHGHDRKSNDYNDGDKVLHFELVSLVRPFLDPYFKEGKLTRDQFKLVLKKVVRRLAQGSKMNPSPRVIQNYIDRYIQR